MFIEAGHAGIRGHGGRRFAEGGRHQRERLQEKAADEHARVRQRRRTPAMPAKKLSLEEAIEFLRRGRAVRGDAGGVPPAQADSQ